MPSEEALRSEVELLAQSAIENLSRYLASYRYWEYDWSPIDRLSRARSLNDMREALYRALRRQDRILKQLINELKSRGLRDEEAENRARKTMVDHKDVEALCELVEKLARTKNLELDRAVYTVAKHLAVLAAARNIGNYIEWLVKRQ